MRIIITGRHIAVTAALKRYIETRLTRLERYGLKVGDVQVVLTVEKYRHAAEVVFRLNGAVIQGKTSTTEMYGSIDHVLDKITRQILKRKEKLVNHKRKLFEGPSEQPPASLASPPIEVTTVRPALHSLTTAQALARLPQRPAAVLIFRDSATDRVQVMRRLDNGKVELVDPQPIS